MNADAEHLRRELEQVRRELRTAKNDENAALDAQARAEQARWRAEDELKRLRIERAENEGGLEAAETENQRIRGLISDWHAADVDHAKALLCNDSDAIKSAVEKYNKAQAAVKDVIGVVEADALSAAIAEGDCEHKQELAQLRIALPDMPEVEARQQERMNRREGGQLAEDCEALLVALRTERIRAERLQAALDEKGVKLALLTDCTREIYDHETRCGACVTCLKHDFANAELAVQLAQNELTAWRQVGGNQTPEFWADHLSKQVLESAQKDGQIERLQRELTAERRICDGLFEDGKLLSIEMAIKQALLGQPAMMDFMALLDAFKNNQREVIEVNRTFNLQRSRMGAAARLWQKATGRTDTWPDLGDLLAWLMKRAGKERKIADLLGEIHRSYRAMLFPDEREPGQDNIAVRVKLDGLERDLGKLYTFSEAQTIDEDNGKVNVILERFKQIRDRLFGDAEKQEDEGGDYEEAEQLEHSASIWVEAIGIVEEVKRSGCAEEEPEGVGP